MKKVLLAFDGRHFSESVFEFVKHMSVRQKVMAVGVFLPSIDYIELLYSYAGVPAGPLVVTETVPMNEGLLRGNIKRFKDLCEANNIEHKVHTDFTKHLAPEMKNETRFADLLVLSSKTFYENLGADTQEDYIANVLHKAECPVVLIPETYQPPKSIIMAYDGSEQAVFAIKQFAYLLPEFHDTRALLVYFDKHKGGVPERAGIAELASIYFKDLTISKMKIDPEKELEEWIEEHGDVMLVAGAFGRPLLSEVFKKSFVNDVIMHHKVPIFVAHK